LLRELLCKLYSLILNLQATQIDNIGTYVATRGGRVAVGDLPRLAIKLLERARLGRVESDLLVRRIGRAEDVLGELGGPDL
jgi:hypothetical protein